MGRKEQRNHSEFIVREDWEAIDHLKEKTRPKLAVINHGDNNKTVSNPTG